MTRPQCVRTMARCLAVVAAAAMAACGAGLDGKYPPSDYEGTWRIEMQSDKCGAFVSDTYSAADVFGFSAYEEKYYFKFTVIDPVLNMPHRGMWAVRDASTNKIIGHDEVPALDLVFLSSRHAEGTWAGWDCAGFIVLDKIRR